MALNTQRTAPTTGYPALFRSFIANSLAFVLADVQKSTSLSEEQRREGLRSLEYGLANPDTHAPAVALLLALASHLVRSGLGTEWRLHLEQGLVIAQAEIDRAAIAFYLGEIAQFQGRIADAEAAFADSAAGFAGAGRPREQVRSLNRLAYMLRVSQRQDESEKMARLAQSLLEDSDPEWGYSHFVLGVVAFDQQRHRGAVEHLQAALACWELHGDERRRADGLINLAPALRQLQCYDEAVACLEEAGQLYARRRNPRQQGIVYLNTGNIYLSQERWDEALAQCRRAEPLFRQVADALHQAINYNNMGVACRRLKMLSQAERAFRLAIAGFESLDQPWHHVNALDGLGNTLRDGGRFDEAAAVYRAALARIAAAPDPTQLAPLAAEVQEHLAGLS